VRISSPLQQARLRLFPHRTRDRLAPERPLSVPDSVQGLLEARHEIGPVRPAQGRTDLPRVHCPGRMEHWQIDEQHTAHDLLVETRRFAGANSPTLGVIRCASGETVTFFRHRKLRRDVVSPGEEARLCGDWKSPRI